LEAGEKMSVGKNISYLRTKGKMTQKDLADILHLTPQAVSRYENGQVEPGLDILRSLSETFHVSIDELVSKDLTLPSEPPLPSEPAETMGKPSQEESSVAFVEGVCNHEESCDNPLSEDDHERVETPDGDEPHNDGEDRHRVALSPNGADEPAEKKDSDVLKGKPTEKKPAIHNPVAFGWGIASCVAAILITILTGVFLYKDSDVGMMWIFVASSVAVGYLFFSLVYCLIEPTYIQDVFLEIIQIGFVKFPGIIFSFDLDGVAFLIIMKILFWILGALFALFALSLAVAVGGVLAMFSFPFYAVARHGKPREA
jgi:transcriptional regulator with XRE-family HTH domain